MSSNWKTVALKDVSTIVGGGTPSTTNPALWGGEVAWLTPKDLSSHNKVFVKRGDRNITEEGLKNSSARLVPPGSVLFTSRAPIGYVAIAENTIATNQGFKSLILKDGNDSVFFYYLLRHYTKQIEAIATGSTFKEVSGNALANFEVEVPTHKTQKKIGEILGSLDDRITLLRETNATLEAIAQALFKSWFVDFDPVRAKAEGREPEGMPAEVADLFPSEFEETELGEIPKGWKVGTVKDLGEVICGKTPPTSDPQNFGDEVQFITIPDMHNRLLVSSTARYLSFKGADSQKNKYLPIGSICVSCIATPGLVVQTTGISQTNQQINSVIPDAKFGSSFALFALQKLGSLVRQSGLGGTVFHNLNKSGFENLQLLLPSQAIAQRFNEFSDTFLNSIKLNQEQIDSLTELRDTLLPRLMSGKLRIPDLEEQAA